MAACDVKLADAVTQTEYFNPLNPSGHYMYRTVVTISTASLTFTILRSAHTVFLCVFCVDLRTNSDYFPIQH